MGEDIDVTDKFHTPNYSRFKRVFVRGKGIYLYDEDGNRYLDFLSGIAVNVLGHADPAVTRAIGDQAKKLLHVSNLYYAPPQAELLKLLSETLPWRGRVFFCNSGTEAVEAAIKLARKYFRDRGREEFKFLSFTGSFHGRTYGALSATAQKKYHAGFEPMLPGFVHVEVGDRQAYDSALQDGVCAVMFEPIQGEGGVRLFEPDFLRYVCERANERELLLICDEIQTGIGRTGRFYSFEHYGVIPHIITLAKGIANGLPLGAMIAREDIAVAFTPGAHGSTFGGNLVSCAAAVEVVKRVKEPGFLEKVYAKGEYLRGKLEDLSERFPIVNEVRGRGLMQALVLSVPGKEYVNRCLELGLIVNCTEEVVLRMLPPLIVENEHIDAAIDIIQKVLSGVKG
ncbi:MAG: acetylornithine/succinylornithine family transaminase [Deltaproteobacteria bacterium]|nr:acetylornithine/succinylornithine family transaminase [Deltaproteobacteria bacterium]